MKHLGDITKIHGDQIEPVDCITFGSPCQDLSMAGKRLGFDGNRSVLFLDAARIIKEMRTATNGMYPTFAVWENVPGAFSSNNGEDFRTVLEELARIAQPDVSIPRPSGRGGRWSKAGAIAGNGWSLAWRQLDAQYWGVPQRRKRIALVADFGGRRAGKVLFECTGLPRNPDPCIPTWQEITGASGNCPARYDRMAGKQNAFAAGNIFDARGNGNGKIVPTITGDHESRITDYTAIAISTKQISQSVSYGLANTLGANDYKEPQAVCTCLQNDRRQCKYDEQHTAPAVTAKYGTGGINTPLVIHQNASGEVRESKIIHTLSTNSNASGRNTPLVAELSNVVSYGIGNGQANASVGREKSGTLDTMHDAQAVAIEYKEPPKKTVWIVRRLTPTECERLQGYPDGWTDIGEWVDTKGKKHKSADGPRYKALGNSIALPQWFWIAQKMKQYLPAGATLGSLFDGIGGFPLVWEATYGKGTARWASEIESFCVAVTKRRFGEE